MSDTAVLLAKALTRTVETGNGPKTLVDQFTYTFERGHVYSVLGPSGAGKTSLLRLLNRLDAITGGEVLFDGTNTRKISPCKLRKRIGYLFQVPHMFEGSVRDNLLYANADLTEEDMSRLARQTRIREDQLGDPVDNLSLGERQRVALARLLATEPDVALLDEPTSALDPANTESIEDLIRCLAREHGLTMIVVSHNPEQAVRIGGTALLMVTGRLIESGTSEQIVNEPRTELGRRYRDRELT